MPKPTPADFLSMQRATRNRARAHAFAGLLCEGAAARALNLAAELVEQEADRLLAAIAPTGPGSVACRRLAKAFRDRMAWQLRQAGAAIGRGDARPSRRSA